MIKEGMDEEGSWIAEILPVFEIMWEAATESAYHSALDGTGVSITVLIWSSPRKPDPRSLPALGCPLPL
jgi:hypothetical protein